MLKPHRDAAGVKAAALRGAFLRHISDVEVFLEKPDWYKAQNYTAAALS